MNVSINLTGATIEELKKMLDKLPNEYEVYACGAKELYINFNIDKEYISFDYQDYSDYKDNIED